MFFEPSEKITRAEMSVMLANALKANAHKQTDKEGNFADLTFRPENNATRAEAATTLYKLLEALYL